MNRARTGAWLGAGLLALACRSGEAPGTERNSAKEAPAKAPARPVFVRGPTGGAPVAPFIAKEVAAGASAHYGVLVYVGATWCEPCQRFHAAAQAGEFDSILSGAHLVEFDLDESKGPLADAGYSSELVPLFCVPKPDGTASPRRIEGSIKGPEAINQNLVPRLRAFLGGSG